MNLLELTDLVCLETGYNDAGDVAAAKKFFRHWDEHIWNAALWKSSLAAADIAVDPGTDDNHAEGIVLLPGGADRVVAVRSATNSIGVRAQEYYYRVDADSFVSEGAPYEFHILSPVWLIWRTDPLVPHDEFIAAVPNDPSDLLVPFKIVYRDQSNVRKAVKGIPGAVVLQHVTRLEVEAIYKPVTAGDVKLTDTVAHKTVGTMLAAETRTPSYQRIRLIPKPTTAVSLKVLVKTSYSPMDTDQSEPSLQNAVASLCAFVRGSLKRRGQEIGAAQTDFGEANGLLKSLMGLEAFQAAHHQCFVPGDGFGSGMMFGPCHRVGF